MEKNINNQCDEESNKQNNKKSNEKNNEHNDDQNNEENNKKCDNFNKPNKISVLESIKTNYLSWIFIIFSVILVSYPSIIAGFITFFIFFFLSYFTHIFSHMDKNVISILHHYHHDNNNFFSHFSQILLELFLSVLVFPLYYFFNIYLGYNFIDIWIGLLYVLFYSSVHNYNYGQLRINYVHYLHHKNMFTNIGPDICDIAFNTKHPDNKEVENTNHYIPNVILSTIFILFMKYLCIDKNVRDFLLKIFSLIMSLIFLFLSISSIYLYVNLK
jgi:hypothetical protein